MMKQVNSIGFSDMETTGNRNSKNNYNYEGGRQIYPNPPFFSLNTIPSAALSPQSYFLSVPYSSKDKDS